MQHDSRSSDSRARNLDGGERVKSYSEKNEGENEGRIGGEREFPPLFPP